MTDALTREKIAEWFRKEGWEIKDGLKAEFCASYEGGFVDLDLADLAASLSAGEGSAMETTAEQRADIKQWLAHATGHDLPRGTMLLAILRDFDRLLALSAKAREEGYAAGIEAERREAVNRARSKP